MFENRIDDNEHLTMDIGIINENVSVNIIQYTLNGSYIMNDGTVVLVEEDFESYINETLVFMIMEI